MISLPGVTWAFPKIALGDGETAQTTQTWGGGQESNPQPSFCEAGVLTAIMLAGVNVCNTTNN